MHVSDEQVKKAAVEFLSHKGERPYRVTRRGAELWEDYVPAMRAALLAALAPVEPEPVALDEAWDIATEALDDSMDMDWTTRRGARSVVNALKDAGFLASPVAPTPSAEDDMVAAREAAILASGDGDATAYAQSVRIGRWDNTIAVQSALIALIALRNERTRAGGGQ